MRALITALLLLFAPLALGQAATSPFTAASAQEFLPVEEAYQLEVEVIDDGRLRLYWQITDSYYLYQHAFKFKASDGVQTLTPKFPPALERTDEYFGDVSVYYNQADIMVSASPAMKGARIATRSMMARIVRPITSVTLRRTNRHAPLERRGAAAACDGGDVASTVMS